MHKLLPAILIIIILSCNNNNVKSQAQPITKPVEHITPTNDQEARRKRSEEFCKLHGVPVYKNPNALFVASEDQAVIRSKDEVVDRALALCYMGLKSEGLEEKYLNKFDKDYSISKRFSPLEKEYANSKRATEQQKVNANWRYESLHVMLWALGFIDSLRYPDKLCVVADDVKIIFELTEEQFRQKAKLRSKKEILDQADLILRIDWACVSARLKNAPAPANLNSSVVFERHHSLNWLINYKNQAWDDVTTDT